MLVEVLSILVLVHFSGFQTFAEAAPKESEEPDAKPEVQVEKGTNKPATDQHFFLRKNRAFVCPVANQVVNLNSVGFPSSCLRSVKLNKGSIVSDSLPHSSLTQTLLNRFLQK